MPFQLCAAVAMARVCLIFAAAALAGAVSQEDACSGCSASDACGPYDMPTSSTGYKCGTCASFGGSMTCAMSVSECAAGAQLCAPTPSPALALPHGTAQLRLADGTKESLSTFKQSGRAMLIALETDNCLATDTNLQHLGTLSQDAQYSDVVFLAVLPVVPSTGCGTTSNPGSYVDDCSSRVVTAITAETAVAGVTILGDTARDFVQEAADCQLSECYASRDSGGFATDDYICNTCGREPCTGYTCGELWNRLAASDGQEQPKWNIKGSVYIYDINGRLCPAIPGTQQTWSGGSTNRNTKIWTSAQKTSIANTLNDAKAGSCTGDCLFDSCGSSGGGSSGDDGVANSGCFVPNAMLTSTLNMVIVTVVLAMNTPLH